ncbi:hypothetical protein ACWC4J_17410 [Streptomyces sp. NPDC001356]
MRIPLISTWIERRHERVEVLTLLADSNLLIHRQLDELLKLSRRRELLVAAAENLVDKLDDQELAESAANAFTATELFPIVDLLRTAGRHEAAKRWTDAHEDWADLMSDEDQDQGEADHALYLETGNPYISVL